MTEAKNGIKNKRLISIIIIAVLAAGIGALCWWLSVRSLISTDNAKVNGDLVNISPEVSGKLVELCVAEGQQVQTGQIVARLDDSQYKINLKQAKGALDKAQANYAKLPSDIKSAAAVASESSQNVASSQAQLQSAQTALADAQRNLNQAKVLSVSGAIAQNQLDEAQSSYDKAGLEVRRLEGVVQSQQAAMVNAQSQLDALNNTQAEIYLADMEQAQAAYDSAQLALSHTKVTSGISGTILRIPVAVGEDIASGQTVVTVCNLNEVWIEANIDEDKSDRIKIGQKAEVMVGNYPGITFHGAIAEVGNASESAFDLVSTENTSGNYTKVTQRVTLRIKVDNRGYILKPGLTATVKIYLTRV